MVRIYGREILPAPWGDGDLRLCGDTRSRLVQQQPDRQRDLRHGLAHFLRRGWGIFENAVGPRRRVYSIDNGDDQSSVVWGTPAQQFGLGSSMVFEGASFSDIAEGEEFTLGTLSYFNGTINTGSELDSIDLTLDLTLDVPELSSDVAFSLGLINTVNEIFNTADQNADYVQLESVVSTLDTVYLGETYYLQIRFGSVASNGFSTIDQFHVHEGATASGSLIGVITRTPWTPE
ncbi:MAG: choice-of-anchor K domain-containing protein [Verrucomicrobiales bacterium]